MLQNWLKPPPQPPLKQLPKHCLAHQMTIATDPLPDLKKVSVALIGIDSAEADAVRQHLWRTTGIFPEGAMADLGNLRKADAAQLIPVVFELLSSKVLPILIGRLDDWAKAQFLSYQDAKNLVNLAIVDERPRFSALRTDTSGYNPLLHPRHNLLFHLSILGLQAHQTPPETVGLLEGLHFEHLRLGRSRAALEEAEPLLRDADLLALHLGALKSADAAAVEAPSPSGYQLEEACQLARYAGMSDKLTSFGIYGYRAELDTNQQTAQTISQLVWYFLEGFFNRKGDYPVTKTGLTEYVVDLPRYNYQLVFWKSLKSGRWWLQAPAEVKRKQQRHRLIPCSFQDYQMACREELPDRLIQAFKRFG
jgi:formiminoglutamase